MFKKLIEIIKSFFPSYKDLQDLGYQIKIINSDLILYKELKNYRIDVHQSLEPFHPEYKNLIDFEIEGSVIVIKGEIDCRKLENLFQYIYPKGEVTFCFDKHMKFDPQKLAVKVQKIELLLV